MTEVTGSQIRSRFEEVTDLIDRHRLALVYLEKERDELEVALRVVDRFDERPDLSAGLLEDVALATGGKKPSSLPTVPEMIMEALVSDRDRGGAGLRPKDILRYIRETYWPDAPSDAVGPVAWRMWSKEGRIEKSGDVYFIGYENETPAGAAAGASEPGAVDDDDQTL